MRSDQAVLVSSAQPLATAVVVYSDGSSSGKSNRPGGWGYVVVIDDYPMAAACGGSPTTTNNIMEATGAIQGLLCVIRRGLHDTARAVVLVADSQYVLGLGTGLYHPTTNLELAGRLRALFRQLNVKPMWVRGHAGNRWNERVDRLAKLGKVRNTP